MSTTILNLETSSYSYIDHFENSVKTAVFTLASYLTDPICKAHELYRRCAIVQPLNPNSWQITNVARKALLLLGACYCFLPGVLFTTFPGLFYRFCAANLQSKPYIYWKGNASSYQKKPESFTVLSWNICAVGAGYAITDGGVMPWPFRIDSIAKKISQTDADAVCLSEVFDIKTASQLYDQLKDQYAHFYVHIGPRTLGVSSGLFVASKYNIQNPSFTPFPKEMLMGRTKNSEKGVFSFELGNFATIFTTHLQHSEEPAFPTQEAMESRRQEMALIIEKVNRVKNRAIIVTGDLNMEEAEFKNAPWASDFNKGEMVDQDPSWGGDEFCAKLVKKKVSGPLNLDHTLMKKGSAQAINTCLIKTSFDGKRFKEEALSDHAGLLSRITLLSKSV